MASTTFASGTVITSTWLNDVNSVVWTVFNGSTTVAAARTALGLGSMALQAASAVAITGGTITGGTITGITDLAVADGGTGASTAANARANLGAVNIAGDTLTGALNEAKGTNIASAATVNLDTATGNFVHITGTTTITAITLAAGAERTVIFDGILTLTQGASLLLPGGASLVTVAGDRAVFRGDGSGVVYCTSYIRVGGVMDLTTSQTVSGSKTFSTAPSSSNFMGAWCTFDGTTAGTNAPTAGFNVSNITRNGTGDYTINFTNALSSANYAIVGMGVSSLGGNGLQIKSASAGSAPTLKSTTQCTIITGTGAALQDTKHICVLVSPGS